MFNCNLVARTLMRLAAALDPETVLDAQYKAFCDWCKEKGLFLQQQNRRDHKAVFENSFGRIRFWCEEFRQDALCLHATLLEGGVRPFDGKKWELLPDAPSADVTAKLDSFAHDLGLANILKMSMAWEDYMEREIFRCNNAYKRVPGVKTAKCLRHEQATYGEIAEFEITLDLPKQPCVREDFQAWLDGIEAAIDKAYPNYAVFSITAEPKLDKRGFINRDSIILKVGIYDELEKR
ncbi:MAG: hypothetical protein IKX21_02030 [Deltaproteobacteria bacterium]|nr:hypothetical protein [Deltaproteobacteria bacterium]